jgi:hypothetical protein
LITEGIDPSEPIGDFGLIGGGALGPDAGREVPRRHQPVLRRRAARADRVELVLGQRPAPHPRPVDLAVEVRVDPGAARLAGQPRERERRAGVAARADPTPAPPVPRPRSAPADSAGY